MGAVVVSSLHLQKSVLADVREELAGAPPRGSKRFITPMQLAVNYSVEN
jgi:hypothetical protein